jgi:hypothetical protein
MFMRRVLITIIAVAFLLNGLSAFENTSGEGNQERTYQRGPGDGEVEREDKEKTEDQSHAS